MIDAAAVARVLAPGLGDVDVQNLRELTGGASRATWAFDAVTATGARALILRVGPPDEIHAGITVYEAVGCEDCTGGYKGRAGIYQVMPMTEEIQQIVLAGGNVQQLTEASQRSGVRDLRRSALDKVKQGITSLVEINRVTKD